MKEAFASYYGLEREQAQSLWHACTFVFDSSSLLNLYRYPTSARNAALDLLTKLKERLWIPHQVAFEYQTNRLSVIAEQIGRYRSVEKTIIEAEHKIETDLANLQLKKRHSLIDPDELIKSVKQAFNEYRRRLETLKQQQPDVHHEDPIRKHLDVLFAGRTGNAYSQKELEVIYQEGAVRYAHKRPPGYMDAAKGKNDNLPHLWQNTHIQKQYGDLVLWRQLIDWAARTPNSNVIFITDDDKEDWWWIVDSQGEKTIGPRPELVQEAMIDGKMAGFYMYNSERFLKYARSHLGIEFNDESISQIKQAVEHTHNLDRKELDKCILNWLQKRYNPRNITEQIHQSTTIFSIRTSQENSRLYQVHDMRYAAPNGTSYAVILSQASSYLFEKDRAIELIFITERGLLESVHSLVLELRPSIASGVSVSIGSIESQDGPPSYHEIFHVTSARIRRRHEH
jgi:hypothetical protein